MEELAGQLRKEGTGTSVNKIGALNRYKKFLSSDSDTMYVIQYDFKQNTDFLCIYILQIIKKKIVAIAKITCSN